MAIRAHGAVVMVLLLGGLTSVCRTASPQTCPTFTEIHLPGSQPVGNRFATFPGGFVLRASVLTTDTDGASTAYHPDDIGSTLLCDGLDVYRDNKCVRDIGACTSAVKKAQAAHWDPATSPAFCAYGFVAPSSREVNGKTVWGAGLGNGPLPVQQSRDPAPGFFISVTARPVRSPDGHGVQYADADRLPYLVMPSVLVGAKGPTGYLNAGAIVRTTKNRTVYALVADENESPAEISVAAAQLLHDPALTTPQPVTEAQLRGQGNPPWPYRRSNATGRMRVSSSDEGPYIVFALSSRFGRATDYDPSKVDGLAKHAFEQLGGIDNLTLCAKQFFGP